MTRPVFSDLSAADKIALLTKLAKRYARRGNVPKVTARGEVDAALRGTTEEQVETLERVVAFLAGWAGVSNRTIAEDLNDTNRLVQDPQPKQDETMDRILKSYLFLNREAFEKELMEKGGEGRDMSTPSGLTN